MGRLYKQVIIFVYGIVFGLHFVCYLKIDKYCMQIHSICMIILIFVKLFVIKIMKFSPENKKKMNQFLKINVGVVLVLWWQHFCGSLHEKTANSYFEVKFILCCYRIIDLSYKTQITVILGELFQFELKDSVTKLNKILQRIYLPCLI